MCTSCVTSQPGVSFLPHWIVGIWFSLTILLVRSPFIPHPDPIHSLRANLAMFVQNLNKQKAMLKPSLAVFFFLALKLAYTHKLVYPQTLVWRPFSIFFLPSSNWHVSKEKPKRVPDTLFFSFFSLCLTERDPSLPVAPDKAGLF